MGKEFIVKTTADWVDAYNYITGELHSYVQKTLDFKPFEISIDEYVEKKSYPQLKGYFRICGVIVPYLKKWTGEIWNKDRVNDFIKIRSGFCTTFKGVQVVKSCKDATKEEMTLLIQQIEVFGAEMEIPDCKITSRERMAFDDYYKLNEGKEND